MLAAPRAFKRAAGSHGTRLRSSDRKPEAATSATMPSSISTVVGHSPSPMPAISDGDRHIAIRCPKVTRRLPKRRMSSTV